MFRLTRGSWRLFAARAAIVGLVAQALVLAFHVPPSARAVSAELAAFQNAVICSLHSRSVLPGNVLPADDPAPAPVNAPTSCPLCLALAACGVAPLAMAAGIPVRVNVPADELRPTATFLSLVALVDTVRSRGPPQTTLV